MEEIVKPVSPVGFTHVRFYSRRPQEGAVNSVASSTARNTTLPIFSRLEGDMDVKRADRAIYGLFLRRKNSAGGLFETSVIAEYRFYVR